MADPKEPQATTQGETWNDLDEGLFVGSRMFYQLLDEEGGSFQGRNKVPATITAIVAGERNEQGQRFCSLAIGRPARLGGSFDKDDVPINSSREQGSCDSLQPGDFHD